MMLSQMDHDLKTITINYFDVQIAKPNSLNLDDSLNFQMMTLRMMAPQDWFCNQSKTLLYYNS